MEEEAGLSFVSRNCYPFTESSRLIYFDYQIRFIHKTSSFARVLSYHLSLLPALVEEYRDVEWMNEMMMMVVGRSTLSLRIAHYLFQFDVGLFNGTNPISKARKNDYTHTQSLESIGQKHLVDW